MTNIIILSLSLIFTNSFPYGVSDKYGFASADYSWNLSMTYSAPPGIYAVEWRDSLYSYSLTNDAGYIYLIFGMAWTELNNDPYLRGLYTNTSTEPTTIVLPIWPSKSGFFRLKPKYF